MQTVAVEREENAPVLTASALMVTARIVLTSKDWFQDGKQADGTQDWNWIMYKQN